LDRRRDGVFGRGVKYGRSVEMEGNRGY
jgi:hypothetical protein